LNFSAADKKNEMELQANEKKEMGFERTDVCRLLGSTSPRSADEHLQTTKLPRQFS
jgi:hypothetical protein